jgi:hypothetical protein
MQLIFAVRRVVSKIGHMSSADILELALDPVVDCLTPDSARRIVALRADPLAQQRLDELADLANEGKLSAGERADYERFLAMFHFITLLQSKARRLFRA